MTEVILPHQFLSIFSSPCSYPPSFSPIHSLTHICTLTPIHSQSSTLPLTHYITHSFIHSLTPAYTSSLLHPYSLPLFHPYTQTTMHPHTPSHIHSYTHSLPHIPLHSYTHTLYHSCTHSLYHSRTHTLYHSYPIESGASSAEDRLEKYCVGDISDASMDPWVKGTNTTRTYIHPPHLNLVRYSTHLYLIILSPTRLCSTLLFSTLLYSTNTVVY